MKDWSIEERLTEPEINFMTRRTLEGSFLSRDLGHGVWSLKSEDKSGAQLYVTVRSKDADAALRTIDGARLDLDWQEHGVTMTLTAKQKVHLLKVRSAIIHEARPRLYDALPLAGFDPKASRFWQRVFVLIRIPGGRLLLRWLARRKR